MNRFLIYILLSILIIPQVFSDNVKWERSLSVGASSLNSSSLFDVIGTTKGSRPYPSMTTTQRNAITSPATGLTIFNTTTSELNIYNGSTWTVIANTSQSQTFTNKTIVGTANSISGLRHGTEVDNPSSGVHGVTGNVVGTTDSQILTNKTIVGTANSISGLRHGTEVDSPSSGVHGVAGTIVGTTDTQTLSNKSISDALSYFKISIPASPASGFVKLYAKSDDRFYKLDSSGNEKSISPIFTPSAGGVFVSNGTPDSFALVGTGSAGQYLRSSGTSPPTWSDVFTFTPSAGNIFYSQGTPGAFALTTTGTPGQYLQSNGSSAPTWTSVSGGGAVYTPSAGSIFYSDATTSLRLTTVGTPGQLLQSNGAGTPSWLTQDDYNQNYLYNGDMEIWNEGTALVAPNTNTHGAEGYRPILTLTDGVANVNRSTSVPTVSTSVKAFNYSYEVDITTADATIAAGQRADVQHYIEGNNFKNIHQKQVTLSFWVYATKTGTSCVFFKNSAGNRSYIAEYTISSSNTWEYKTVTLNLDTSGTWLLTAGVRGLFMGWALAAGSTFQTTAGSWQSGDYYATSNQVNHFDSTSNFFRITGAKLNLGPTAIPFTLMGGNSEGERAITQRYFQTSYLTDVTPGASGVDGYFWLQGYNTTSGLKIHTFTLPVQMCKAPTMVAYDYSGNSGRVSTYDAAGTKTDNVAPTSTNARVSSAYVRLDGSTLYGLLYHYTLNARL